MSKEFDLKKNIEDLMRNAIEFQINSQKSRASTNKEYCSNEPELHNSFRITLDGLIARCIKQLSNKIEEPTEKISYQISLAISFVRTHFIINDMILEGDLIEGITLIRKNLESATRLHEIDKSPLAKLLRKTPNVINIFGKGGKKLYPTLSEIAHFGTPRVGGLLTVHEADDGRIGPSLYPSYNIDSLACYDKHAFVSIYFVFWLIEFLKKTYKDEYEAAKDETTFLILIKQAEDCGIIEKEEKN